MVKLDPFFLKFLTKEDFRVLTALEMGMKNHDLVPTRLINSISNLKFGGCHRALGNLHRHKLIYHESKPYDGYRLTYPGYDYLVLKTMTNRGSISALGNKLGTGKESDIYLAQNDNEDTLVIKLQRLGRTSFRSVKNNRDYLGKRKSASWLYFSRLAAIKEYSYMKALYDAGFPVPKPIDHNRHAILMTVAPGYQLNQVKKMAHPGKVYTRLMEIIVKLAEHGLIHGDLNEFNIMVDNEENVTMIDFPQMVSTDHINADMYFERDVNCIRTFFERRYGYKGNWPVLSKDVKRTRDLDKEVEASGFSKSMQEEYEQLAIEHAEGENEDLGENTQIDQNEEMNDITFVKVEKQTDEKEPGELNEKQLEELEKNIDDPDGKQTNEKQPKEDNKQSEDKEENAEQSESDESLNSEEEEIKKEKDRRERMEIQKKVKKQLAHREKRKKGVKNQYKERDRRAVRSSTKDWSVNF